MSATDLRPCTRCRRHVRIAETTCPFCAAALVVGEPPILPVGRLTRAAVFASAVLAGSCGKPGSSDTQPVVTPPPSTPQADAAAAVAASPPDATVADAAAPPDAAPPDAAVAKKKPRPDAAVPVPVKPPDHMIPKPYGAPPARSRLV